MATMTATAAVSSKSSCPTSNIDGSLSSSSCSRYIFADKEAGETTSYILRGLSDDEVATWSEFCASVFAYKKPSPPLASYFRRHFDNDPDRDSFLIRVAFLVDDKHDNDGQDHEIMVASCRVFHRKLYQWKQKNGMDDVEIVNAGGIGEVCTHENHRRRGLSKALLRDGLQAMSSSSNESSPFQLSILHAAPTFYPVYQASGYQNSTTCAVGSGSVWSRIESFHPRTAIPNMTNHDSTTADSNHLMAAGMKSFTVRRARFPQDAAQLGQFYHAMALRFQLRTLVRSTATTTSTTSASPNDAEECYWTKYLGPELGDSWYVLEGSPTATSTQNNSDDSRSNSFLLGSLALRYKNGIFHMAECTWDVEDTHHTNIGIDSILAHLLPACLEYTSSTKDDDGDDVSMTLQLPTFICNQVEWLTTPGQQQGLAASSSSTANHTTSGSAVVVADDGWMYKILHPRLDDDDDHCHIEGNQHHGDNDELTKRNTVGPLLIWPADSF